MYGEPGVAAAAIALQDESGLDVNMLLLCLWSAVGGPGRLDRQTLQHCLATVADWRASVLMPIRALRRQLAAEGVVREHIAAAELSAEHVEQQMLSRIVVPGERRYTPEQACADATCNLDTYCQLVGVQLSGPAREQLEILLAAMQA